MDEELTSGEEYVEPEEVTTIPLPEEQEEEETQELTLLTIEDIPLLEYGAIGSITCGTGLLLSLGICGILSILRKA